MKLLSDVVGGFKVVKVFREHTEKISSIDFSHDGDRVISSGEDDQIVIYDCETATGMARFNSKKYGVDLIRFAHAKNTVLHSSTKIDHSIRYLSLYDNQYIRYFPGHTKKVVSLCISPVDDTFLSGSLDQTLRLWDVRAPKCAGLLQLECRPVAEFDPRGLVFATGVNSGCIKIYDLRCIAKGPFITAKLVQEKYCVWTGIKFSRDGNTVLISTNGPFIRLIDAYYGRPLHTFAGYLNSKCIPIEASFSPDSKFVFSGSTDGRVHVWDVATGYKVHILKAGHTGPVQYVQFNPNYMLLASAGTNMSFWCPA